MLKLIGLAVLYVLSAYVISKFFKIAYSSLGRWSNISKSFPDYVFNYAPFINTLVAFMILFEPPYRNDETIHLICLLKRK